MMLHLSVLKVRKYNMEIVRGMERIRKVREMKRIERVKGVKKAIGEMS